MIIFVLYLFNISVKKCPNKIKRFYAITLILLEIRYLTLLLFQIVESSALIYKIKAFALLDFLAIPLMALVALYIFLRDENRTFDYNFVFMVLLFIAYLILIYLYKINITIDIVFGFVVGFKQYLTPSLIYLIIIGSISVITLLLIDKPYSIKAGMRMLLLSLMIILVENILFFGGIKMFPYPLFGHIILLGCSFKAISTFK
jgi:hypothetical protein